jgi:hypothetical protein
MRFLQANFLIDKKSRQTKGLKDPQLKDTRLINLKVRESVKEEKISRYQE